MKTIEVYQADAFGFFLYVLQANELSLSPGQYNIPYGAYADAPPAAVDGMVAKRVDGAWTLVEDHRAETFYRIVTPATGNALAVVGQYQLGVVVDVDGQALSYDGGGPVPAWLTTELPPQPETPQLPA